MKALPRFVALDGEGVTIDNRHRYVLLASSTGAEIRDPRGLSTEAVLDWLLDEDTIPRGSIPIMYGAQYDWTKWLHDLPQADVAAMLADPDPVPARYRGRTISVVMGKTLTLVSKGRRVTISDILGYFQASFVAALDEWLPGWEGRDAMSDMKAARGTFTLDQLDEVAAYNRAELARMVELADELRSNLHTVGLFPRGWHGPGAVADALLRREGWVNDPPGIGHIMESVSAHAFFGGRAEVFQHGPVGDAVEFDLNSAYPAALMDCPLFPVDGWVHRAPEEGEYGFVLAHYRGDDPRAAHPLPFRHPGGVAFPPESRVWVHSVEYEAAARWVARHGGRLTILDGWAHADDGERPFRFLGDLYAQRREMKRAGNPAQRALRLALNSVYGKTAQRTGWKHEDGVPKRPRWHNLAVAGFTTAWTRASVLDLMSRDPDSLVFTATDAVVFNADSHARDTTLVSDHLGGWEFVDLPDLDVVASGVYFARRPDGADYVTRMRGVPRGQLTRALVEQSRRAGVDSLPMVVDRFMTLTNALSLNAWDRHGQWEKQVRELKLYPTGKRVPDPASPGRTMCAVAGGVSAPTRLPWLE